MTPAQTDPGPDPAALARDAVRALAQSVSHRSDFSDRELGMLAAAVDALGMPPSRRPMPPTAARSGANLNPWSPEMTYTVDADGLRGTIVFPPIFDGLGGFAHGGFIALALDNALGSVALIHTISRTATITIDYKAPAPISHELQIQAGLERMEGRKVWVSGSISDAGRTLAEARGLWVALRPG